MCAKGLYSNLRCLVTEVNMCSASTTKAGLNITCFSTLNTSCSDHHDKYKQDRRIVEQKYHFIPQFSLQNSIQKGVHDY